MKSSGTRLASLLIFVGSILMASCAKPYHDENERYVFVATNISLPYWQEAQAGLVSAPWGVGLHSVGPARESGRWAELALGLLRVYRCLCVLRHCGPLWVRERC